MERKRKMEREKQRERERKKSEVVQRSVREDMGGSGLEMGEAIAACAYDAWAHSVSLTGCVSMCMSLFISAFATHTHTHKRAHTFSLSLSRTHTHTYTPPSPKPTVVALVVHDPSLCQIHWRRHHRRHHAGGHRADKVQHGAVFIP